MEFLEHEVIWDDVRIKRFWSFIERTAAYESRYFSRHAGPGIVRYLKRKNGLSGRVLDYGAGKGYLLDLLLDEARVEAFGVEFAAESVANLSDKLKERDRFGGCYQVDMVPTELAGTFDWVLLIETLEHLDETRTTMTLNSIRRILRPGGKVFVTVPRTENLDLNKTLCPECGAIFHIMQHQRTFDPSHLTGLMQEYGFRTLRCEPINFDAYRSSWRHLLHRVHRILRPWLDDIDPNLVYIGSSGPA